MAISQEQSMSMNGGSPGEGKRKARRMRIFRRSQIPQPTLRGKSWPRFYGPRLLAQPNDSDNGKLRLNPSSDEESVNDAMKRTKIMLLSEYKRDMSDDHPLPLFEAGTATESSTPLCTSASAMLEHSYLDLLCGPQEFETEQSLYSSRLFVPEDPSVQESIECVFASQLDDGIVSVREAGENEADHGDSDLMAPSVLQQSLLRTRSDLKQRSIRVQQKSSKLPKKRVRSTLIHLEPYETASPSPSVSPEMRPEQSDLRQCSCSTRHMALPDLSRWPQRPLLLRATPGSGTRVKGIRFAGSTDYLWHIDSGMTWSTALQSQWGNVDSNDLHKSSQDRMCSECVILPINNGNEQPGKSLVTDFESDMFDGTLLLRLRYSEGTTRLPYEDTKGYFAGVNRRYQAVVRGKFKCAIPCTHCVTGFELARPCGKLPAKWIVKGALKVISFFAPQLEARLDGDHPASLAPLGSTPQCVIVQDDGATLDIEKQLEEPRDQSATLLGVASDASASMQRARFRKKAFDRLFAQKNPDPMIDPNKIYTFEFLQHLFNFQELTIELGSMVGSISLKEILNGQPLQIMAATTDKTRIWSFDIWHESLFDDARIHENQMGTCT